MLVYPRSSEHCACIFAVELKQVQTLISYIVGISSPTVYSYRLGTLAT
jgi:hypothetical protein